MTGKDIEGALAALAVRQGGVWTRAQVRALGGDDRWIRRRRDAGAWHVAEAGVYVAASAPGGFTQRCWAAHLAAGPSSVVSHRAAATLWALAPIATIIPVVTVRHGHSVRLRSGIVQSSRDLQPGMIQRRDGLPLTSPARTVADLASVLDLPTLGKVVDAAITIRRLKLVDLHEIVRQLAPRGRRGMGTLAAVLDERAGGQAPPASELERRFAELVLAAGLPAPNRQVSLPARRGRLHVVDALFPDEMVIVELDGRRWHLRLTAAAVDRERDNYAAELGYLTVRYLWEHVVADPIATARNLDNVLRVRRAQLSRPAA